MTRSIEEIAAGLEPSRPGVPLHAGSRLHVIGIGGTASYQIVLQNNQPTNENIEFANCEFTDDHDFGFFRYCKNLQFHHNFLDNFNDDGLECGPKLRDHTLFIHENHIGRVLIPFSQHEMDKDESPVDHAPLSGSTDNMTFSGGASNNYADPNGIMVELCRDTPGFTPNPAEAHRLLTVSPFEEHKERATSL